MNRQQRRAAERAARKGQPMMNMPPGGRPPIQMPPRMPTPSGYICPQCGVNPPMADNSQLPFGTPVAQVTRKDGEEGPTFHCLNCYNVFMVDLIRLNVPVLRRKEEVEAEWAAQSGDEPSTPPGEESDDAEG